MALDGAAECYSEYFGAVFMAVLTVFIAVFCC